jgi:hypothetical protein
LKVTFRFADVEDLAAAAGSIHASHDQHPDQHEEGDRRDPGEEHIPEGAVVLLVFE